MNCKFDEKLNYLTNHGEPLAVTNNYDIFYNKTLEVRRKAITLLYEHNNKHNNSHHISEIARITMYGSLKLTTFISVCSKLNVIHSMYNIKKLR